MFARVVVLFTAFKRLASGRTLPVRGSFRRVRMSGFAFRPDDASSPIAGALEVELASLTTDAPERDENVIEHLFGRVQTITGNIAPAGQMLASVGDDAWTWRGFIELTGYGRTPIVLAIQRRRLADRTEIGVRLARPLEFAVSDLGLPFAAFVETLGVRVVDRVEIDVGVVFDEKATRRRVRVVVAGAGIAGLAAAQALVDAGCDVTILEKERFCGGKLTSHVDESIGHTVEHGIHGVFPRYENLAALWRDAGIDETIFSETTTMGVASPSGMVSSDFHRVSGPAPISLPAMIPRGILRGRDLMAIAAFLARVYGASADRALLDGETFQGLLDRYGVSERVQRFIMHPYIKNLSYARPDQVSAAAACDALGYYLVEDVDNFKARWFDGGPQELVIDPWVAALAKRGVRFLTSTPVQFILFEGGRFQGFATRAVIPASRLGTRDRCWVQRFGSRVVALRWAAERSELRAWDGLCTHAGCPLSPAGENGCDGFRCDCHGGAFDVEGRVVRAPPAHDLPSLPVVREQVGDDPFWKLALDDNEAGDALVTGDYGVVALDVEGARKVLTREMLELSSTRGIPRLGTTPLMVLRMWFRGETYAGPDSGFFQASDLLDNFFVLSRFQREFREVAGYTVVECHIGDCAAVTVRDDEDVLEEAARCIAKYFPELGPDNLDAPRSRVLRHQGFTLFAPGDAERTPSVAADDRQNLLFAGDWVRSEVRSWFMERSAATGIEAANHVLAREGYVERELLRPEEASVFPTLIGLPFRASGALGRAYRAVVDGVDDEASVILSASKDVAREGLAAPRLVDLESLLYRSDVARVHARVREFFETPTAFDIEVMFETPPLLEHAARRGLPVPPFDMLGLLGFSLGGGSRQGDARRAHPFTMRVRRDADGRVYWNRAILFEGVEVSLVTSRILVADDFMREVVDVRGTRITFDYRASVRDGGVVFELVRAAPTWAAFAVALLSHEVVPTTKGVAITSSYRHRVLRVGGKVRLSARRRRLVSVPPPLGSEVRLSPSSIPPSGRPLGQRGAR